MLHLHPKHLMKYISSRWRRWKSSAKSFTSRATPNELLEGRQFPWWTGINLTSRRLRKLVFWWEYAYLATHYWRRWFPRPNRCWICARKIFRDGKLSIRKSRTARRMIIKNDIKQEYKNVALGYLISLFFISCSRLSVCQ